MRDDNQSSCYAMGTHLRVLRLSLSFPGLTHLSLLCTEVFLLHITFQARAEACGFVLMAHGRDNDADEGNGIRDARENENCDETR